MTRRRTAGWAVATLLLIALATLWGVQALRVARADAGLRKALATLKTPDPSQRVDCQLWRAGAAINKSDRQIKVIAFASIPPIASAGKPACIVEQIAIA